MSANYQEVPDVQSSETWLKINYHWTKRWSIKTGPRNRFLAGWTVLDWRRAQNELHYLLWVFRDISFKQWFRKKSASFKKTMIFKWDNTSSQASRSACQVSKVIKVMKTFWHVFLPYLIGTQLKTCGQILNQRFTMKENNISNISSITAIQVTSNWNATLNERMIGTVCW